MRATKVHLRMAEIIALHSCGLSDAEIAAETGLHPRSISSFRQRRGIPPNAPRGGVLRATDEAVEQMVQLNAEGLTGKEIAARLGMCSATVTDALRKRRLYRQYPWTDEMNLELACMYEAGLPYAEIADSGEFPTLDTAQKVGARIGTLRRDGWITERRKKEFKSYTRNQPRGNLRIIDPDLLPQEATA